MSIVFVILAFVMLVVLAGFVLAGRRAKGAKAAKAAKAKSQPPRFGVNVHDQYLQMVANESFGERVEQLKSGL